MNCTLFMHLTINLIRILIINYNARPITGECFQPTAFRPPQLDIWQGTPYGRIICTLCSVAGYGGCWIDSAIAWSDMPGSRPSCPSARPTVRPKLLLFRPPCRQAYSYKHVLRTPDSILSVARLRCSCRAECICMHLQT